MRYRRVFETARLVCSTNEICWTSKCLFAKYSPCRSKSWCITSMGVCEPLYWCAPLQASYGAESWSVVWRLSQGARTLFGAMPALTDSWVSAWTAFRISWTHTSAVKPCLAEYSAILFPLRHVDVMGWKPSHLLEICFIRPSRTHIGIISPKDIHHLRWHLGVSWKVVRDKNEVGA